MDDESDESPSPLTETDRNGIFSKTDTEISLDNTARISEISSSVSKFNSFEDNLFRRKSRIRNVINEADIRPQNLVLPHTISTESVISKGSRNYSPHSPAISSFRSIRNSTRREACRSGINMVMVIGFAFVMAFGYIFKKFAIFLNWCQFKLNETQSYVFGGKTIAEFYAVETSPSKKFIYSPVSGFYYVSMTSILVFLKVFDVLKRPAPQSLVKNVFQRYVND